MENDAKHLKNERTKQWLKDNPDQVKIHRARYRIKLRERVFDVLGSFCVHCGFTDVRALQIDHRYGGGNAERKRITGVEAFYRRVIKHPEQYQILCANCNWIKRYENGELNEEYRLIAEAAQDLNITAKKSAVKSPLDRMLRIV